jgi:hypothetical protein
MRAWRARSAKTLSALIDLHIDDMKDVGKPPQRYKSATLEMLQRYAHCYCVAEATDDSDRATREIIDNTPNSFRISIGRSRFAGGREASIAWARQIAVSRIFEQERI